MNKIISIIVYFCFLLALYLLASWRGVLLGAGLIVAGYFDGRASNEHL
jgi:hypothetical protein